MSELTVILPIETVARELDFKLALAAVYTRKRHRTFIVESSHSYALIDALRGGLYVGKHAFFKQPSVAGPLVYHRARARGFRVVHLSEEGAVFNGGPDRWRQHLDFQLDPKVLAEDDLLCTWGNFQREHYLKRGARPEQTHVTGHPRFDLYREPWRSLFDVDRDRLRQKYGRFVLINTNFAAAIHPTGLAALFSSKWGYKPHDPDIRMWYVDVWSHAMEAVPRFVRLVHKIQLAHPGVAVVLRPHPSDDIDFFRKAFADIPRVHVVREGPVTPWLAAAEVVVHDGCTTGLEAHLMGRPVITYGAREAAYAPWLPSVIGHRVQTEDDALRAVREVLTGGSIGDDAPPPSALDVLENLRQPSYPLFTALLEEAEAGLSSEPVSSLVLSWERARTGVDRLVRRVAGSVRSAEIRASHRETQSRFPGFDADAVRARVQRLKEITGRPLELTVHGRRLLEIRCDR